MTSFLPHTWAHQRPCRRVIALVLVCASLFALLWPANARADAKFTKGPYLLEVAARRAVVRVEVDPPTPLVIDVRPASASSKGAPVALRTIAGGEARALVSFALDGLEPSMRYRYDVRTADSRISAKGQFATAPSDDSRAPFSFIVYGDSRTDETAHASVARAVREAASDFLVNTGDYVENGDNPPEWQTFFDIEGPLLRDQCLFACVGNHELFDNGGVLFARYLTPPSTEPGGTLYGTFRWGDARFFLLNAFHAWAGGEERDWLERELAKADVEAGLVWRFVVVHHGPWSAGPHGNNARLQDAKVPDLLAAHKVDLVLSGHDHIYERGVGSTANGRLRYVVSGGAGARVYKNISPLPSTRKAEASYHYVEFRTSADGIALTAKRADGTIIERCGFTKGVDWDCDGVSSPLAAAATASKGAADPPAPTSPADPPDPRTSSKCGCNAPGRELPPAAPIAGLAATLFSVVFARRRKQLIRSRERG